MSFELYLFCCLNIPRKAYRLSAKLYRLSTEVYRSSFELHCYVVSVNIPPFQSHLVRR